jgi:hypothetical protein
MSRVVAASFLVLFHVNAAFAAAPPSPPRPIAVFLDDASPATRAKALAGIGALGGRVLHAFPETLVVALPEGGELSVYRLAGVREVALNGVTVSPSRGKPGSSFGIAAWNAIATGRTPADRHESTPGPLEDDALVPPTVSLESVRAAAKRFGGSSVEAAVLASGAPLGATELTTSEFLAGAVSINIILVESDGSIDASTENWSASRENDVVARIALGLEWIRAQEELSALRFVYHVIPGRTDARGRTGYEPIRRSADPSGSTGEDRWVKDVLAKVGYTSGDRFARSRALVADTRSADGTDWAVNVFVVDSLADGDGAFADGRFAYCWIGGPHLVMTYDNQAWGIGRMDMVLRHELLHAFYAFDEYAGSSCACSEHRGYLDGANTNCETCNPTAGACVMISNGDALCAATRRQIGWADLDGDGMIDVVGEDPDTFLDAMPSDICGTPVLAGLASVVAATNRNTFGGTTHPSISVNRLADLEFRVDGMAVPQFQVDEGDWGVPQERFRATLPTLPLGPHLLEVSAVDDFGNRDPEPGSASIVVHAGVAALGDSVRAARNGPAGLSMTWVPCSGATRYRVYRRSTPGGAESVVAETSATSWIDGGAATGYFQVRPVDACGGERSD